MLMLLFESFVDHCSIIIQFMNYFL